MSYDDANAPLPTEFAIASDGVLYVHEEGEVANRKHFVGYALLPEEMSRYGVRGLLTWAMQRTLALGSDGHVYVEEGAIERGERRCFRGYATTPEEAEEIADELHRIAFNATAAFRHAMPGRLRKKPPSLSS